MSRTEVLLTPRERDRSESELNDVPGDSLARTFGRKLRLPPARS